MVALAVSVVCSVFVAGAAVSLKPVQIENRQLDKQRSILSIAGSAATAWPVARSGSVRQPHPRRAWSTSRPAPSPTPTIRRVRPAQGGARPEALRRARRRGRTSLLIKRRERFTTGLHGREGRQAGILILPIRGYGLVHAARLHGGEGRPQHRGRHGLLPARRGPGPRRRSTILERTDQAATCSMSRGKPVIRSSGWRRSAVPEARHQVDGSPAPPDQQGRRPPDPVLARRARLRPARQP